MATNKSAQTRYGTVAPYGDMPLRSVKMEIAGAGIMDSKPDFDSTHEQTVVMAYNTWVFTDM